LSALNAIMMDAARLQMHVVTATVFGTHTRHAPHHHVSIKLIAARSQHRAQQLKPLHANSQTQTAQHHFKIETQPTLANSGWCQP